MKLEKEKTFVMEKIKTLGIDNIKEYTKELKESKNYKNFNTRLCFDVLHAIDSKCEYVNFLYNTYNCNDSHIETLMKQCLKDLKIL